MRRKKKAKKMEEKKGGKGKLKKDNNYGKKRKKIALAFEIGPFNEMFPLRLLKAINSSRGSRSSLEMS